MTRPVDYSALTRPVNRDELRAFKHRMRSEGHSWASMGTGAIIGLVFAGFIGFVIITSTLGLAVAENERPGGGAYLVVPIFCILLFGGIAVAVYQSSFGRKVWETRLRLHGFAAANGLIYSPRSGAPSYPGAIFGLGHTRSVSDHVRSASGRFLDIGNYTYITGSGKSRQSHSWGFMAFALDRSLPHMMLDSRANNSFFGSNLPASFSRDQVLSLEGDFDRYFTLYAPRQYERDALYVFTPDLMALLIDEASPYDVEIVDKWMFVYSSRKLDIGRPEVYERMFRIIDTVGAKTLSQTDRYADERVGDRTANVVAPQGQRLKRGIPVLGIIATVVFAAIWLLPRFFDLFN